ncbi:hypothetical protein HDU93_006277 [Gonapodya sp. JEL0774]|nr:hypothetical protein HDU93_006277 [Gonapodya sp. JEL0774]
MNPLALVWNMVPDSPAAVVPDTMMGVLSDATSDLLAQLISPDLLANPTVMDSLSALLNSPPSVASDQLSTLRGVSRDRSSSLVHLYGRNGVFGKGFTQMPLELSIFDDLDVIHAPTFLSSPRPHPILLYSIISSMGAHHEDFEIRRSARRVFYPRLQKLLKAEWEAPSIEGVIGLMHGTVLAGHWKLWDQSTLFMIRLLSSIHYLGLHSEAPNSSILAGRPGFPAPDPWVARETARRVFWVATSMDTNMAASSNVPRLMSGDEARGARLPCPLSEWAAPSLPTSTHTTMPTLGEIVTPSDSASTSQIFVTPGGLYAAFLYLFSRVVDFHRYCAGRGWLPFAPPDGTPVRRVRAMAEEIEEELNAWKEKIDGWAQVDANWKDVVVVNLQLGYHALWTVLHGPTVSLIKFGYELLTPVEHRSAPVIPKLKAEDALEAWSTSKSFVTAVSHAFEASSLLDVLIQKEERFREMPAGLTAYFLGHVAVILLLPALRMQQAGLDVHDIRRRSEIILAEMRLLETECGPSVINLVTSIVELMLQKLDGQLESFGAVVQRLFVPDEGDQVVDVIDGSEQIQSGLGSVGTSSVGSIKAGARSAQLNESDIYRPAIGWNGEPDSPAAVVPDTMMGLFSATTSDLLAQLASPDLLANPTVMDSLSALLNSPTSVASDHGNPLKDVSQDRSSSLVHLYGRNGIFDKRFTQVPLELSIFDDLAPPPSTDVVNSLVLSFFLSNDNLDVVHAPTFLSSPRPHPILLYAIISSTGAHHEDFEIRRSARRVFYPRLQKLLKAEWDAPSIEGVIGLMHGTFLAGYWKLWDQFTVFRIRLLSAIHHLGLHSEAIDPSILAARPGFPEPDPWVARETARRVFWATTSIDANIAASSNVPRLMSGDEARGARLPCPLSRVVDVHRYCAGRGWLPFAPPDGTPVRRVRVMVEEVEEELNAWKEKIDWWSHLEGNRKDVNVVNLHLVYHALWTVLHGPTVSLIKFSYELLTPEEHRSAPVITKMKAEDALEAWCTSKSFVTAVSHAIEASTVLDALIQKQERVREMPARSTAYFLGHVAVILLLPALRMQQAGLDVHDIRRRSETILAEMRLLEIECGPSAINMVTSIVELILQKLDGRFESFGAVVHRLFVPDENDHVVDVIDGSEPFQSVLG